MACFETAITVVISIFVIRLTLAFTGMASSIVWSVFASLLPFVTPDWLREPFSTAIDVIAELALFGLLVGYAWAKARYGRKLKAV